MIKWLFDTILIIKLEKPTMSQTILLCFIIAVYVASGIGLFKLGKLIHNKWKTNTY